jgi:hypothetical protein
MATAAGIVEIVETGMIAATATGATATTATGTTAMTGDVTTAATGTDEVEEETATAIRMDATSLPGDARTVVAVAVTANGAVEEMIAVAEASADEEGTSRPSARRHHRTPSPLRRVVCSRRCGILRPRSLRVLVPWRQR